MNLRHTALSFFAGVTFAILSLAAPVTPAHAQVSAEFQAALQPHGAWRRHARWGMVWAPSQRPRDWRPYTHGRWVYTEEWGWYWISDRDEEDWGWVTYHYGRWVFDRGVGWVWVRGDEWAPAWVAWRRGDDAIGWAAMPPDDLIDDYDEAPDFWIFVPPRYLTDARPRAHILPSSRSLGALRATVVVSRTQTRSQGGIANNPGIAPAIVAAASRASIPAYRVTPRVLAGTKGVTGAVAVKPSDLARRGGNRFGLSVQKTAVAIKPVATVPRAVRMPGRPGAPTPRPQAQPQPAAEHGVVTPIKPKPIVSPAAKQSDRPPPQAKPHRPIAPQTPPPAVPRAGTHAPPSRPAAPVATPVTKPVTAPVARPKTPEAKKPPRKKLKPGEKPDDKK